MGTFKVVVIGCNEPYTLIVVADVLNIGKNFYHFENVLPDKTPAGYTQYTTVGYYPINCTIIEPL